MRKRHVIVDGYNVVRTTARYRADAERDLESAREMLISDVAAYVGPDDDAVVVFDGAGNPGSDGEPHAIAGIHVVFSPFGTDADAVIEGLVARHRRAGEDVVLVTSDQAMQWTAIGPTVTRRSSTEFVRELAEERTERWEHAGSGRRGTVGDRIGPDVRRRLERWAGIKPSHDPEDGRDGDPGRS